VVKLLVVFGDLGLLGVVPGWEDLVELDLGAPLLGVDEPDDGGQNRQQTQWLNRREGG
jgi:hypothetical protein